jgi:hypothetical protein
MRKSSNSKMPFDRRGMQVRLLSFRSKPLLHVTSSGGDDAHRSRKRVTRCKGTALPKVKTWLRQDFDINIAVVIQRFKDGCLPSSSCGERIPPTAPHVRVDKLAKSPAREVGVYGFESRPGHQICQSRDLDCEYISSVCDPKNALVSRSKISTSNLRADIRNGKLASLRTRSLWVRLPLGAPTQISSNGSRRLLAMQGTGVRLSQSAPYPRASRGGTRW